MPHLLKLSVNKCQKMSRKMSSSKPNDDNNLLPTKRAENIP